MKAVPVKSEISGTVWKIEGRPGVEVELDDVLLILESMKMEIPVLTEVAGTVSEVAVGVGDVVSEGDLLVRVSPH